MCQYGTYKWVTIINPNQNKKRVAVDACIADEIQELNDKGVITLGCCCGHGRAGKITEWENCFGKWKGYYSPPHTLIEESSVELSKTLGYIPFPYNYSDGEQDGVWQMQLKSGCITLEECDDWHIINRKNS
jgi:hypothetical protein